MNGNILDTSVIIRFLNGNSEVGQPCTLHSKLYLKSVWLLPNTFLFAFNCIPTAEIFRR